MMVQIPDKNPKAIALGFLSKPTAWYLISPIELYLITAMQWI